jgi:hypothetical protein
MRLAFVVREAAHQLRRVDRDIEDVVDVGFASAGGVAALSFAWKPSSFAILSRLASSHNERPNASGEGRTITAPAAT